MTQANNMWHYLCYSSWCDANNTHVLLISKVFSPDNVTWLYQPILQHIYLVRSDKIQSNLTMPIARFVKVYCSHKLCRNVPSHNSCGNASGISPSYKGCGSAVCHFLNQVQECQNLAFILCMENNSFNNLLCFIL